jgi:succinyl-diaminopimelate desuccinylase
VSVVSFLQDLIRIESLPKQEAAIAARVLIEFRNFGFDEAWKDHYGNVFGLVRGTEPGAGWMLLTHLDQVDVGDHAQWQHPPFSGLLENGVIHGRGAVDIKGPLAAQTHALAAMLERHERPKRNVILCVPVEEETGGWGIAKVVAHLPLETPQHEKLEIGACIVGEPSGNRVMLGHRGVCRCTVFFHGRAHHASLALKDENPHYQMALFLTRLYDLELPSHPILGSSSICPTVIRADTISNNLSPNQIDLTLDWRTTSEDGEDVRRILSALTAGLNASFSSYDNWQGGEDGIKNPGFYTEPDQPDVLALQKTLLELSPDSPEPGVWNFATDGRYLHHAGIACVGFGPGDQNLAHTTKESIALGELELHMAVLEKFLTEYAPSRSVVSEP